jgi:HK97 family phage prohead protease
MNTRIEFKAKLAVDDAGAITALAWPFAKPDRIGDVITKGAFAKASLPIPMLFGHDFNDPVGAWHTATEDAEGLRLSGNMLVDEVPRAREVRALVRAGAVPGISIGFITKKSVPRKGGGRTISELELLEASLVTIPLHPGARITSAKSAIAAISIAEAINRATAALTGKNAR